ncbi:fimbria/pilus outer membrane usher protein [Pantoea sp. KPR_PJ]
MLKELGYDASAADLLSREAHFLPGDHPTNIIINNQNKGIQVITFDQEGAPCWTEDLLARLGVDAGRFDSSDPACLKPGADSDVHIKQRVDRSSLELQLPADALLKNMEYVTGGKALLINYDARRYQYQPHGVNAYRSDTLTTEVGANIEQWILRSGQSYSRFDRQSNFTRLYSYAQRSVPGWSSVLQIGEITSADPLFSGITLTGAQITPEETSHQSSLNQVAIDVLVAQAGTVEVWQKDVLLKTFPVDAGMNTLSGIPAINQQDAFLIISHDAAGGRQQQSIPYIQARPVITLMETGPSLVMGRLRLTQDTYPLVMGSTGVFHNSKMALSVGALASEHYQAGAWRASMRLTDHLLATLTQTYSLASQDGQQGGKKQGLYQQAGLSLPVTQRLSLSASANYRSRDYVDTNSSWSSKRAAGDTGQIKSQYAAGLSYSHPWLGIMTFSGSLSHAWQGNAASGYALGWGRSFGRVNVNLGIQKNRLTADRHREERYYTYLNFSVPLGNNSNVRGWVNHADRQIRTGIGYDHTVNDKFAWSLSGDKRQHGEASLASSATWTNKYTQLSGGFSHSESSASYNAGARGGAVWHGEGITFTPRTIGDTFGIISLNSDRPDVEIRTPGGMVWSDRSGHAVASWNAWQKNTVQINPQSLPKNVQVPGGIIDVTPYRGAVVPVVMPAFTVRRALVTFQEDARPAPGSPVKNSEGTLVAFVNEDGTLFFDDLPDAALFGQRADGSRCSVKLLTPWTNTPGTLYATLTARCVM